ncbi:serine/threonine-protein kinase [Streptomyces sp. NPDC101132]|uniref:serine/threonine-protein kinase n=1 Tax=Streptomyces sp. NPDC101132 TaxID=3366110 RepID=UPI00382F19DA
MDTSEAGRRLIDGRFELLARLGSGGMGTVWRARDISLDREVALKEVRPPDPAVAEANPALARTLRERAVREARALARLADPHVVTIHQIIEPADGSHPWIVMELVQGGSLADRLDRGSLPVADAVRIGLDVLAALRAAHAAGVHHRDVKPANVLLRPNGGAVLTDFGIAALRGSTSLTATGDLIGSPEYIAPERIRGEEGHPASDLWSLGMMLYVSTEGMHPLRRATTMATMVAVLEDPVPPPVRSGPLGPVLAALLVRDPAARPDAERLEELLRAAGGTGGPTAPSGLGGFAKQDAPPVPQPPVTPVAQPGVTPGAYGASPYGQGQFGQPGYGQGPYGGSPYGAPTPYPPVSAPVGYGGATTAPSPVPAPRPSGNKRSVVLAIVICGALLAGTVALIRLLPDGSDSNAGGSGGQASGGSSVRPTAPATTGTDDKDGTGGGTGSGGVVTKGTLLTPANVRAAVASFKEAAGTDKVVEITIYEQYAMADITPKGRKGVYDDYRYDIGGSARRTGPGSTLDADDEPIDLAKVNWDALPGLIKRADSELGVEKPTMRYVIVDRGLIDKEATMRVYVSDEYGGGYLQADLTGKVQRLLPRS